MGVDFLFAAVEMPDKPADGQGGLLYANDATREQALAAAAIPILVKLREAISSDDDAVNEIADANCIFDVENVSDEVYEQMRYDLLGFWNGDWERYYSTLDTYDKDGNPITLTVTGDMSWGDSSEPLDILWRFAMLPAGWWK